MTTRQKKKEAFAHVMGSVLDFDNNSPMMTAMEELEYDSIEDIVTMDKEEVMGLLCTVTKENEENKENTVEVTKMCQ